MRPASATERVDHVEGQPRAEHYQIGDVAERTGLSLRTIRYYEEVALVTPSTRTHGGFRLYTDADIARLALVARMRPLGFSLDEMRDLLEALDTMGRVGVASPDRATAQTRVAVFQAAVEQRCANLRDQLTTAERLARSLRSEALFQPDDAHGPSDTTEPVL